MRRRSSSSSPRQASRRFNSSVISRRSSGWGSSAAASCAAGSSSIEASPFLRMRSSARLRAIATIQVIGVANFGSKLPALCQILRYASWMTSSARSLRRKIRSATPYSFARVAAYRRSNAASSPFATAAISHTSSADVSIATPAPPARWRGRRLNATGPRYRAPAIQSIADRRARARSSNTDESRKGLDPQRRRAHRADAVHLGLVARILGNALARLVAFVEQLDLLQLFEGLGEREARLLELGLELIGRTLEIVAPNDRGLRVGWICEMRR